MAPYAEDSTDRLRVRYTGGGRPHIFYLRLPNGNAGTIAAVLTAADYLMAALRPYFYGDFAMGSVDYAAQGSSLFLPVAASWPFFEAAPSSGTAAAGRDKTKFISFQGISTLGARWGLTLYGPILPEAGAAQEDIADYRLLPGEGSPFTDVLDGELYDLIQEIRAIDGMGIILRQYVNVGYSAYYQRKARRAG